MSETHPKDGASEAVEDKAKAPKSAEAAAKAPEAKTEASEDKAPAGATDVAAGAADAQAAEAAAEAAAGAVKKRKQRGDSTGKLLRIAIILVFVGLALELVPLLYFRPITFVIFFFLGIPIAGLGMLIYVWRVLRNLRETGAL